MDRARSAAVTLFALSLLRTTSLAAAPPAAPIELQAFPQSDKQIRLSWIDTARDEQGFKVELNDNGTFRVVKTVAANAQGIIVGGLARNRFHELRVRAFRGSESSPYSNVAGAFTDDVGTPSTCSPDLETACLGPTNRFRVQAELRAGATVQQGLADQVRSSATLFAFGDPEAPDLLVRLLDGCALNQRYWIFAAGTTTAGITVTVTDTQAGRTRRYFNPLFRLFAPIQDTSAFATCP